MGGITQSSRGVGINQTWKDVLASRASGTTYTNNTSSPICVVITVQSNVSYNLDCTLTVDSLLLTKVNIVTAAQATLAVVPISFIVPSNSTYSLSMSVGSIIKWYELS